MASEERWLLLVYRVPSQPSRARVSVWRELRRLGAFYLQQAICVLPDAPGVAEALGTVRDKIRELGGTDFFAVLDHLDDKEREYVVTGFRANAQKEYAEIVEECATKFFKEIEFERFRENYTFHEAEEIRHDLEKLRRWLAKAIERDWMETSERAVAEERVQECERLLEEFEADVFERSGESGEAG